MRAGVCLLVLVLAPAALAAPPDLQREVARKLAQAGDDVEAQVAVVQELAARGDPEALPVLAELALEPRLPWQPRAAARSGLLAQQSPEALLWAGKTAKQHKKASVRALACDLLAARSEADPRAGKLLLPALEDDADVVRLAAIQALSGLREPVVVAALVRCLEHSQGRVAGDCIRALQELTGEQHGSAAEWTSWWAAVGDGYTLPDPNAERVAADRYRTVTRLNPPGEGGRTIFESIDSQRVVFVIDVSYSMRVRVLGGEQQLTRLDYVKQELSHAIEDQLDKDDQFDVIVFSDEVQAWKPKLVKASGRNKKAALHFVGALQPTADTNISDALEAAFQLPDVDTIYFLTDGTPNRGKLQVNDEILAAVQAWNAGRGVRICAVAFLAGDAEAFQVVENKGMATRFLKKLAEQNQGTFRSFE